ncbi:hypothetical protein N2152v2_008833 [Parachlorella kessleri]
MAFHSDYDQLPAMPIKQLPIEHATAAMPAATADSGQSDGDLHLHEDSLALLPRHTVVQIVGNNRTKVSYLGLRAVVKRAQGLGGWHFLVLPNGEEIKLQRNALVVLQLPRGDEQDFSDDEREDEQRRMLAEQQQRQRQLQRQRQMELLDRSEGARSRQRRTPRPPSAQDYVMSEHQPMVPMVRTPEPLRRLVQPTINLGKLDISALKRYSNFYQLPEPVTGSSKEDLVLLVTQHFAEQTVDEAQVISHFLRAAKRHAAGSYRPY